MKRILLILLLLAGIAQAQDSTQALVESLIGSDPAGWESILKGYTGSLDESALRPIVEKSLTMPLPLASKTVRACDLVAARIPDGKGYQGLAQLALARALLRSDRKADALAVVSELAAAHPELSLAQLSLGFAYLENARYDEARLVFEKLTRATPFNETAWLELGRANVLLNRKAEARAAFREVLAINSENVSARDALASLDGVGVVKVKTSPEARAHFEKGEQLFADHKFEEAAAAYRLAAQADPKFVRPLVYIGDCYFQLGRTEQAIASYREALQVDPSDKQANRFLGTMLERQFDQTGESARLDEAIAAYKRALQTDPSYGRAQADLERAEGKRR